MQNNFFLFFKSNYFGDFLKPEVLELYKKAGKISFEVKQEVLKKIESGMKIIDLANLIESEILKRGAEPAFPVNIGINEITAHYTPTFNDLREIKPGDLVKIDIGIHVDGYIADMAFTYCSEKNPLIEAVEKALDSGLKLIKPGILVSEISEAIENAIKDQGFGPITNLTGHGLDRYSIHAQPTIPNVSNNSGYELKEWDVIALEPFVTNSPGHVKDSGQVEIYSYLQTRPVRLSEARKILDMAQTQYHGLPFAKRWLAKMFSPVKVSMSLRQLEQVNAIQTHPVLKETQNRPVAQAEDTVIVAKKPIITTRPPE